MKIAYFVHDLNDAAVKRRVEMFRAAGADVTILGFRRRADYPTDIHGARVIDLGRTEDSRMAQRAAAVLGRVLQPSILLKAAAGADIIIGRNLEAFALAARARRASPHARLVYECLDIHRLLIETSFPARILQKIQARLLRNTDLILTSSPAFVREYFEPSVPDLPPVHLLENKLLKLDDANEPEAAPDIATPAMAPPWTIGWFGMLRCRKTFDLLADIVGKSDGRIRVLIAGRPSPAEFDDFEGMVAAVPGFTFHGPYTAQDLPRLYGECHFAWAIDFFEEGMNSSWLLPNRLYEAIAHHVVPIGLESVEIGKWLSRHDAGLVVMNPQPDVADALMAMDGARYGALRARVEAVPRSDVVATLDDCRNLMAVLQDSAGARSEG